MNEEKQIDEMAETICRREFEPKCKGCYFNYHCRDRLVAEKLYKEGYRKKSDVAREIFKDINAIKKEYASGNIDENELYVRLYMLEKKYMEGNYD